MTEAQQAALTLQVGWIGALSALGGAVLGAAAVLVVEWMRQRRRWDATRREAYAEVLAGAARVRRDVLQAGYGQRHPDDAMHTAFQEAVENADLVVAKRETSEALRDLSDLLLGAFTDAVVFAAGVTGVPGKGYVALVDEKSWVETRAAFNKAARAEAGLKAPTVR